MTSRDHDALLTLTLTPELGSIRIQRLLSHFGDAARTLAAPVAELAQIQSISRDLAGRLRTHFDRLQRDGSLDREHDLLAKHNVRLLALSAPDYPPLLKHIPDPPPLLYVRGEIHASDSLSLAIVGSRKCTQYGREQADRFAAACAQAGLCIISGGAYGVDAAAHRATLRLGGRTLAVIGSGLAKPYPDAHADLFNQIADGYGAVISELPMATAPAPENFPARNRIISGLSLGVLVIEAAERSGALITARQAVEEHHREVMALPGRVDSETSAGCHRALREGWAALVTKPSEVLDALGEAGQMLKAASPDSATLDGPAAAATQPSLPGLNLTESQRQLLAALNEPAPLDKLAAVTGLPVSRLQADLTVLQIRGLVHRANGTYARKSR